MYVTYLYIWTPKGSKMVEITKELYPLQALIYKGLRQVSIHSLCSQEICLWRIKYLVYRTIKYDEYTIKYNGQNNSQ